MITREEERWIKRLERVIKDQPDSLILYSTDGEVTVCKKGVSTWEFNRGIKRMYVSAGASLTDLHDELCNGEKIE